MLVVGILSFLVRRQFIQYDKLHEESDKKHQEHYRHAMNINVHETDRDREAAARERQGIADDLVRDSDRNDQRFNSIENKLEKIYDEIKNILRSVGRA